MIERYEDRFGRIWYIKDGDYHRSAGPAYIALLTSCWRLYGNRHRYYGPSDSCYYGPADSYGGRFDWYIHGVCIK